MNTTLYHSTTHPPDTEDQQVLHVPAPDDLRRLALADRLSLRIGLWLLQRAQRPRRERRSARVPGDPLTLDRRERSVAETYALLTFDLQRADWTTAQNVAGPSAGSNREDGILRRKRDTGSSRSMPMTDS